jgi:hypothetical protein
LEDELVVRILAARFTNAVNQCDLDAFRQLWAVDGTWEIGAPFALKAQGADAIVRMLDELFRPKTLFFQLTHSGVVTLTGDNTATVGFAERGEADCYENLAVYHDEYVRLPGDSDFENDSTSIAF